MEIKSSTSRTDTLKTSLSMPNPLSFIDDELDQLEALNLRRHLAVREGPQMPQGILLDGGQFINFGSNDYLGLANDPRLIATAQQAVAAVGVGSGASPLVSGRGIVHAELERGLALFEGVEATLLFPSGFAANSTTIPALVGKGDVIFSDAKNHASIIDGCRLSGAQIQVYRHNDTEMLEELIKSASNFRRRLIVSDTLFSMDGDFAPVSTLGRIAHDYDAIFMADEAHATGVIGDRGRGVCELLYAEEWTHVRVGTLSKALGSSGGFVAGSQKLIDYLANRARGYVFSTAPPEVAAAAALIALQIVRDEPQRRSELQAKSEHLRERLWKDNWWLGSTQSHIIPIVMGDASEALRMTMRLRERGFFVPCIRPPSVPEGESLLRISVSWSHTMEQLDALADALMQCAEV